MTSGSSGSTARLGLSIAPSRALSIQHVVRLARLADDLGYHSIWIPETWGQDAVSTLAAVATGTRSIFLASGIFSIYSRSAALIAQTAASLQELSGNRFLLGLGTSGPIVVERWHGVPFTTPLERTRAYVEIIREALSGRRAEYAGSGFHLSGFSLSTPPKVPPPIYLAALGPRNLHLTGGLADGWLPIFTPRGAFRRLLRVVRAGALAAGRPFDAIDAAAYLPCVLGPRGDDLLRRQLAYYVGGMGTFYARFMEQTGLGREAEAIHATWQRGDRSGAVSCVSRSMLDRCTLGTDPTTALERLEESRLEGCRLPIVTFPHAASLEEIEHTVRALAPSP